MMNTDKGGISYDIQSNEVTLKELILKTIDWVKFLLSKWIILLAALACGLLIGFLYSNNKPVTYKASSTFVVEGSSAAPPQLSGLATIMGIDMAGGSSGMFQGEGLLALYTSRLMIEKTLFSTFTLKDTTEKFIDRYVRINKIAKNWAAIKTADQRKVIGGIVSDISKNYLKIESKALVSITVSSTDEVFSKEFADKIVENVNSFYIETKSKKSSEAVTVLQRQADSIRLVLNRAMSGAASAIDANPNANAALQILLVPAKKREVDVQAATVMYTEVMRNLEATKMTLRRETPLIQIVDRPFYPLEGSKPPKLLFTVIGGILFVAGAIAWLSFGLFYKKIIS